MKPKIRMLKCMQLYQYTHKVSQELHKTDGTSQGRDKGSLIHLELRVSVTTNTVL